MAGERPPLGARSPPALPTCRLLSLTFLPPPRWSRAGTHTDGQHGPHFEHGIAVGPRADVGVVLARAAQAQLHGHVLDEGFHPRGAAPNTHELWTEDGAHQRRGPGSTHAPLEPAGNARSRAHPDRPVWGALLVTQRSLESGRTWRMESPLRAGGRAGQSHGPPDTGARASPLGVSSGSPACGLHPARGQQLWGRRLLAVQPGPPAHLHNGLEPPPVAGHGTSNGQRMGAPGGRGAQGVGVRSSENQTFHLQSSVYKKTHFPFCSAQEKQVNMTV